MKSLLLFLFILSCSTQPTPYKAYEENEGYREDQHNGLEVISFKANSVTKKSTARLYAEFRALEVCREKGKKLTNIIDHLDKNTSKEIIRTSGNSFGPSYYYGMPFYSRYSGIGLSAGINSMQSNSWKETYVYPNEEVLFRCSDSVHRPGIILNEIPAAEMKHLVKDLKGGLQIEQVLDDSPNKKTLTYGDIILKADGRRIQKVFEFIKLFAAEKTEVPVELLRDGERKNVVVKSSDVSAEFTEAEEKIIAKACDFEEVKARPLCK